VVFGVDALAAAAEVQVIRIRPSSS
jgi:hypothetical protein